MKLQEQRKCNFVGCNNSFIGPPQKKYCDDAICIDARKALAQKTKRPKQDPSVDNLSISKGKFILGTILNIQCSAKGHTGRCTNTFMVSYDPARETYPKYCELHRNTYQRARFEGKISNAES